MNSENVTFTPVDQMTYSEAVRELDSIVSKMQDDRIDIDQLATYTRRAAELLTACRARLTSTEEELRSVLDGIKPAEKEAPSAPSNEIPF